jgi:protein NUD1
VFFLASITCLSLGTVWDPLILLPPSRMNPCTLGWYLPLLVKDVPGALQPSEEGRRVWGENGGQGATSNYSVPDLGNTDEPGKTARGGNRGNSRDGTKGVAPTLAWHDLDAKFRRDLPDEAYIGRLTYRGLIMRACPRVRMLDGVVVSRKEREKAGKLLDGVALAKG